MFLQWNCYEECENLSQLIKALRKTELQEEKHLALTFYCLAETQGRIQGRSMKSRLGCRKRNQLGGREGALGSWAMGTLTAFCSPQSST